MLASSVKKDAVELTSIQFIWVASPGETRLRDKVEKGKFIV